MNSQDVEFSSHAKRKIFQRKISRTLILNTLAEPDHIRRSYENRKIAEKRIGKLSLRVVFVEERGKIIVVTSHWVTSKP